jgi:alkylhydroperoxidase/carboxymuconolactone decarboxylase family protein YurZ
MNKEQLTTILQSCLFAFDGATQEEILKLNSDYPIMLVRVGINLCNYLKSIKMEQTA